MASKKQSRNRADRISSRFHIARGAAMSEYINVVMGIAIASILGIATYGGIVQEHGSSMALEMSGQKGNFSPSAKSHPGNYLGGGGTYSRGGTRGGTSNPSPGGNNNSGGSNSGNPGNNSGTPTTNPGGNNSGNSGNPGTNPGTPPSTNPPGTNVGTPGGGDPTDPTDPTTDPGTTDPGTTDPGTETPPTTEPPSILSAEGLVDFAEGVWEGVKTQGAGLLEMILNPIDTATNFYTLGKALIVDPVATLAAIKDELKEDFDAVLSGDPRELGRVIGENVSPAAIARIASRLSQVARRFDNDKPNVGGCTRKSSFGGDTLVWTDNGLKAIRDIRVGDKVLARNDQSFEDNYQRVTELLGREVAHYYEVQFDTLVIKVTEEHPFWQQATGWVEAKDLVKGNVVATSTSDLTIRRVERIERPLKVYNFVVENDHTYFVGKYGMWVHNENDNCDLSEEIDNQKIPASEFEESLVNLPPGERVAKIKEVTAKVAEDAGMVRDKRVEKLNRPRTVYRDKDGNYYSVDTQHGRFEKTNSKGKHQGEYDIEFNDKGKQDPSGGHDLIVK